MKKHQPLDISNATSHKMPNDKDFSYIQLCINIREWRLQLGLKSTNLRKSNCKKKMTNIILVHNKNST